MRKQLYVFAVILTSALWVFAVPMASPSSAATTAVHCESGANLQAAIDSASPGRTLWVTGTCVGNFVIAKNLKLTANTASGVVTLDGNHTGSVVRLSTGATMTVTGFTITNGVGRYEAGTDIQTGGGVTNLGRLTLNKDLVTANTTTPGDGVGGIVNVHPGVLTITNSVIKGNTSAAEVGGLLAMYPQPMGVSGPSDVTLNNTTVSGNTGALVGGIWSQGPITLSKSNVIGNTATSGKAGGFAFDSDFTLTSSTVSGNAPCNVYCPNG